MFFKQIYEPGLAHASYMIGCQKTGECLVIDAKRDVDTYLEIAKAERLRITHLTETHIHADFLSGTRELNALTSAPMYLSDEGGPDWQYEFDHIGLRDNQVFMVGNIKVEVLHTPGHTPEHISFLVTDVPANPDVPIMLFSGDFVFVGDVGRPDLLEKAAGIQGTMVAGAHQLWSSLQRFRALPDHVQVHPAHGAGSACGKALGAIPSSTVGYEKLVNWALKHTDEEAFIAELLSGQPEPPHYFAMMKKLNKVPRPLCTHVPELKEVQVQDIAASLERAEPVVDTRSKLQYSERHIPGTLSIPNTKSFSTWAGWLLPYDKPCTLIVDKEHASDVTRKLMRIGIDAIAGYLPDPAPWFTQGGTSQDVELMDAVTLGAEHQNPNVTVIDVRGASEYERGHIPGAINIHVGHLEQNLDRIPHSGTVVLSCAGGDRSNIAASVLQRAGYTNLVNFTPGFAGWRAANMPVETEEGVVSES
ncbi:MAG: MBL fold metallo-hydrolase [Bradyrhizobiaceae bacterium]|nr:MBL fold metallo-hydrolase [Bradyrhizobiaceae bacterium]